MGQQVCSGALMQCSFGVAPSSLTVLPLNKTMTGAPAANIMDNKPMMNVAPFGMCQSLANPTVAAATAAAMGVLTLTVRRSGTGSLPEMKYWPRLP